MKLALCNCANRVQIKLAVKVKGFHNSTSFQIHENIKMAMMKAHESEYSYGRGALSPVQVVRPTSRIQFWPASKVIASYREQKILTIALTAYSRPGAHEDFVLVFTFLSPHEILLFGKKTVLLSFRFCGLDWPVCNLAGSNLALDQKCLGTRVIWEQQKSVRFLHIKPANLDKAVA